MSIQDLHELFMKSSGVITDSRKIKNNCIFFSLQGSNFNGNKFAKSAIENGAMYAVIDEEKYFENKEIDFLFGTVKKDRILQGFWPKKIKWKFNIYPSHSGGFFITRKAQKKVGYYSLKFKFMLQRIITVL